MTGLLTVKFHIEFIFYFLKSEIDANLFTITTQVKRQNQQSFAFNKTENAKHLQILLSSQNGQTLHIAFCTALVGFKVGLVLGRVC
jgi:hypothetical protein